MSAESQSAEERFFEQALQKQIGGEQLFRITITSFLDAYNFDVRRVMKCCTHHILPSGHIIPFCAYNVLYVKWIANIRTRTGDTFALPVAVAVAIGRVGCFVAGCCYGRVTTVPWVVSFPLAQDEAGLLRHPTQLYEVVFHILAAIILAIMDRKRWLVGNQLKAYLIAYLFYGFLSEWLRPESPILLNLTIYQLVSVALVAFLILLWVRDSRQSA